MKFLVPTILLVVSGIAFFGFIDPAYKKIGDLRKEAALFNEALENSEKLQQIRDTLLEKYNSFSTRDLERLEKLIPNNVDNVRLVRDLDGIASQYGMSLRDVKVETLEKSAGLGPDTLAVGTVIVSFTVSGPYDAFLSFLRDLERSLRIVDVSSVSFLSSEEDFYEYKMSLRTYWLK